MRIKESIYIVNKFVKLLGKNLILIKLHNQSSKERFRNDDPGISFLKIVKMVTKVDLTEVLLCPSVFVSCPL